MISLDFVHSLAEQTYFRVVLGKENVGSRGYLPGFVLRTSREEVKE